MDSAGIRVLICVKMNLLENLYGTKISNLTFNQKKNPGEPGLFFS